MDLIERPNGLTGAPSLFGQQDFFSSGAKSETEKWNEMELLRYEKEALGFYISGHPLAKYRYSIDSKGSRRIREIEEIPDKHEVQVAGIIGGLKRIKTKGKVETMAYLALEDEEGTMEVLVFPDLYKNVAALLSKERLVMVKGTIDKTEKGVKLIAREVYGLDDYIGQNGYARIEITIPFHLSASDNLKALREIISGNKGKSQVYLKILVNGSQVVLVTSLSVEPSAYLQERIEGLFGKGMVKVG
jgi:DNA polymerase-3 subunit alpha